MNEILLHTVIFITTVIIATIFMLFNSKNQIKKELEKEKYKGYHSPVKKPRILKNDLFANMIYEYREQKAKEEWLQKKENGSLDKEKQVEEDG